MKQSEIDRMNAVIKYSHSSFIKNVVSANTTVRGSLLEMSNQLEEVWKIYEVSHKSDFQARIRQNRRSLSVATDDLRNINVTREVLSEISGDQNQ